MPQKTKKIVVVTGTRSEYGILKPLLKRIKKSRKLELSLLVTGMHLLWQFGYTANEIKADGFKISAKIPMYKGSLKNKDYHGVALGEAVVAFAKIFSKNKPDFLVVFGDRLESLAAVLAAANLGGIGIAHIHAGDKTDSGHIDEAIRSSISRFSHIFFAPTNKCAERLVKMGENKWRVFNTGALGIDAIMQAAKAKREDVCKNLKFNPKKELAIFLFHPVSIEAEKTGKRAKVILSVLKEMSLQTVIIYPNNDAGAESIISEINKFRKVEHFRFFPSISSEIYAAMLKNCNFIIGNSSSGIIEAPAFKVATINVGSRNTGREHAGNVLYVEADPACIKGAIKKVLNDKNFIGKMKKAKNPWGRGGTSEKIVKILEDVKIDGKFIKKINNY